jgi:hypothetical protein
MTSCRRFGDAAGSRPRLGVGRFAPSGREPIRAGVAQRITGFEHLVHPEWAGDQ